MPGTDTEVEAAGEVAFECVELTGDHVRNGVPDVHDAGGDGDVFCRLEDRADGVQILGRSTEPDGPVSKLFDLAGLVWRELLEPTPRAVGAELGDVFCLGLRCLG
ncbi:Uncharacterised protein [Mycobacteroides abscessus subsp. abscessus]|nr:Uncharacterised protein [Mycobacteroides abscessus subsp. abscessus]